MVEKYFVSKNCSVIQAMQQMEKIDPKVVFIEEEKRLLASLTDGDIRRFLLSGGLLTDVALAAANTAPQFVVEKDFARANQILKDMSLKAIPIVDKDMIIKDVVVKGDSIHKNPSQKLDKIPVVLMAGGLGTRLYPYTKILPKPLIPVGDLPIIEHIMNEFNSYGCDEFYLIVNHKRNMIKAYFNEKTDLKYSIRFIDEDHALGTGGGLSLLKGVMDSTFILSNCDILVRDNFFDIVSQHKAQENVITMICSAKSFTIPYGTVEIDDCGNVCNMKEKPEYSFLTNTGCYIVEPRVVDELKDDYCIGFPDIINSYRAKGERVGVFPISSGNWYDMGQLDGLEDMEKLFGSK